MIFSAFATCGCIFWYNLHLSQEIISQKWIQIAFKIALGLVGIGVFIFVTHKILDKRIKREEIKSSQNISGTNL